MPFGATQVCSYGADSKENQLKKLLFMSMSLGAFALAMGYVNYTGVFHEKYKVQPDSALAKLQCAVCHTTTHGKGLNLYGKDIKKALKPGESKAFKADILTRVEKLDSDKDGKSNIAEITAGTNPGAK